MLVLARRQGQCVHFPELDISVEVLVIKGNSIRLGIQAPEHISVLREELVDKGVTGSLAVPKPSPGRHWSHEMRGRLNAAVMGLHLVEKQLEVGLIADAQRTLQDALRSLETLDRTIAETKEKADNGRQNGIIEALLVEDNANEEALLSSYLRMSGFRVETVHNGLEALEFLSTHDKPDFVLLDMHMPQFDGPSTLSSIRGNPAYDKIRLFAVTGSTREESGIEDDRGLDGWFQKPLNPMRIVEAMKAAAHKN